jgi:hypothetical protein
MRRLQRFSEGFSENLRSAIGDEMDFPCAGSGDASTNFRLNRGERDCFFGLSRHWEQAREVP